MYKHKILNILKENQKSCPAYSKIWVLKRKAKSLNADGTTV